MRRLLHLQQHQHTGKILSHRHTSYRSLFVIVALFCLTLASIQRTVGADEIVISAKVAARISTQPAVIRAPLPATVTDSPITTVSGTCEVVLPPIIIAIYSDAGFLGSTVCSASGTFSISITLQPGSNKLVARSVNITDDYGPDSLPITVTYTRPSRGVVVGTPDGISTPDSKPTTGNGIADLHILSKYTYLIYGPNKDAEWVGRFEGGVAPYTIAIEWGDGNTTTRRNINNSDLSISHHYSGYTTYFTTVTVTDTKGRSLKRQFAAVTPYVAPAATNIISPTETPLINERYLLAAIYTSGIALVCLAALAWARRAHAAIPAPIRGARGHATHPKKQVKSPPRRR